MIHIMKYNGSHPRASPMRRFIKNAFTGWLSRLETLSQYCFLIIIKQRILKDVNEHTQEQKETAKTKSSSPRISCCTKCSFLIKLLQLQSLTKAMNLSDHIADNVLFKNRPKPRSPAAQWKVGLWFFATNKQCSLFQSSCFCSWVAQCIFSDPVKEERTATFTRWSQWIWSSFVGWQNWGCDIRWHQVGSIFKNNRICIQQYK